MQCTHAQTQDCWYQYGKWKITVLPNVTGRRFLQYVKENNDVEIRGKHMNLVKITSHYSTWEQKKIYSAWEQKKFIRFWYQTEFPDWAYYTKAASTGVPTAILWWLWCLHCTL